MASQLDHSPFDFHSCYPDPARLQPVLKELAQRPPLVTVDETNQLREQLASAARGERFLLQAGDCAEHFKDCSVERITRQLKIILQMSLVLLQTQQRPIITVGRIAGQYAKPRSQTTETQAGLTLPSYFGDLINEAPFDTNARTPDPMRLLEGYNHAGKTLDTIRALMRTGFTDLHHPEQWQLGFTHHPAAAKHYDKRIAALLDSMPRADRDEFFTSHEALHLPYETSLTRTDTNGKRYNTGTHYPWIGMRTAQLDSAQIDYAASIENPIAVKIGPSVLAEELVALVKKLNPSKIPGRLTLTHRLGVEKILAHLPKLIQAVQATEIPVVWVCDPMHGNTRLTSLGIKTRHFADIVEELKIAVSVHEQLGSVVAGVHFELTGDNVTECIGGSAGLTELDLHRAYHSNVDPRLNYQQALELAFEIPATH